MTIDSVPRRRRKPDEARSDALDAARRLLVEGGPSAITLKAVAQEAGMSHGNLTHHFGSAAALQAALAENMVRKVVSSVAAAIVGLRGGLNDRRAVVDLVFDAFDRDGAGRLIAWLASGEQRSQLLPLWQAIAELDVALRQQHGLGDVSGRRSALAIMTVLMPALAAALVGKELLCALALDEVDYRHDIVVWLEKFSEGREGRSGQV